MGWLYMKSLKGHSGPRQYLDAQFTYERPGTISKVLRSALVERLEVIANPRSHRTVLFRAPGSSSLYSIPNIKSRTYRLVDPPRAVSVSVPTVARPIAARARRAAVARPASVPARTPEAEAIELACYTNRPRT